MPRNKGLGRTGNKKKRQAMFDAHQRLKIGGDEGPSSASAQKEASDTVEEDAVLAVQVAAPVLEPDEDAAAVPEAEPSTAAGESEAALPATESVALPESERCAPLADNAEPPDEPPDEPPPHDGARAPATESAARFVTLESGEAVVTSEFLKELKHSKVVARAIYAAINLEQIIPAPRLYFEDSDESDSSTDDEKDMDAEVLTLDYKYALRALAKAYPKFEFGWANPLDTTAEADDVKTVPCACGMGGRVAPWPWLLQPHTHGFCSAPYCSKVTEERYAWLRASMGPGWRRYIPPHAKSLHLLPIRWKPPEQ